MNFNQWCNIVRAFFMIEMDIVKELVQIAFDSLPVNLENIPLQENFVAKARFFMTGIGFLVREDSEGCLDSAFYYMTKGGFNIYNQKHEDTMKGHFFLTLHDIIKGE